MCALVWTWWRLAARRIWVCVANLHAESCATHRQPTLSYQPRPRPPANTEFKRPTRRTVEQFAAVLEDAGVPVSLRNTRGLEAAAACGQLRNQFQKQPLEEFTVPQ